MAESAHCARVRGLIPELAMGVAPGDERAFALAHIAGCQACRAELEHVATVIDELTMLTPEHEPPPGFDARVLAAMVPKKHPARWRTGVLAAAAAVVLAAGAGGLVRWEGRDDRALADQYRSTLEVADGSYLRAAYLTDASGTEAGHVFAYQGNPSWVFVTVGSAPSGSYRVRLVTTDGQAHDLGDCWVRDGQGSWGTAVDVPVAAVDRLELTHADGHSLTAQLR